MIKKLFIANLAALLCLIALATSCTQEELPALPEPSAPEGLVIDLRTSSIETRATEAGNDDLRENTIETAHVFIFEADGTRSGSETYKKLTFTNGVATLASGDWKNNTNMFPYGPDAQYGIYVVANYHGEDRDLSAITTVEELKAAMDTDADIWKPEHGNLGDNNYYSGKLFTMTGNVDNFRPSEHENNYILPVPVTRIAVKIRIYIKLAEDFQKVFTPTGYRSIVRNHATKGLLWPDNEERTSSEERGLAGNGVKEQSVEAWKQPDAENAAVVVVYTYPNRWGNNALDETFVLLNMPGNYTGESDGNAGDAEQLKSSNYYKIPIRLGTSADQMVLNRNTIYQTTITIDRLGQTEIDKPVELKPKFEVVDWDEETINISDDDVRYLELLKDVIEMKNISETTEQYFTSSSGVWNNSGTTSYVRVVEAYYYDKMNQKQTINNLQRYHINASIVGEEGSRYGYLEVTSDIPTNNGIRYIEVEVKNEQGVTATFLVKQYPLEYIVAVPGWYSYRTDFKYNGSTVTYESGPYESPQSDDAEAPKTSGSDFKSKVYYNGSIYQYRYNRESEWVSTGWFQGYYRYGDWEVERYSKQSDNPNNNMYFVRITKTSNKYTLAVPALDKDGYTDSSNENNQLVSPAFMIASQLGTVSVQGYNSAKTHCREYAEKSLDGEVYEDWRLPTEKELWIIDKYQGDDESVIDRVLAGAYYWAASGKVLLTNEEEDWWGNVTEWNEGTIGTGYSSAYIRCIRDVKANEPIMQED